MMTGILVDFLSFFWGGGVLGGGNEIVYVGRYLAYCTNPGRQMVKSVAQLVGWELTGETEALGENLPQCHFIHHKSHMTWPGLESGY
jgi:hypothetical protein